MSWPRTRHKGLQDALSTEARETRKQSSEGPRETKHKRYALKLTCTGYSQLSRSPEQERERTPMPKHERGTNQKARHWPQPWGKGVSSALWYQPRTIEKSLHSKPKKGLPGQPENNGQRGCANYMIRAPRARGSSSGSPVNRHDSTDKGALGIIPRPPILANTLLMSRSP